jgi:murein L,D-transpeptidase YcbB/YkuD
MKKIFLLLVVTVSFFITCKGGKVKEPLKRDTTINVTNAFSDLFLDSIALEKFITQNQLEENKASRLRDFYNSRNYQFAWFTEDGLAEHTRAFWNLHNNFINYSKDSSFIDKGLHSRMDVLINDDSAARKNKEIADVEISLTKHFFEYAHLAYTGKVDPAELQWHIPRKKVDAVQLLDSLISTKGRDLEKWEPISQGYKQLKKELLRFYDIEKKGGWKTVSFGKKTSYKTGDTALVIRHVKERLRVAGDFNSADTSKKFTKELEGAVKQAEARFGLKADGVLDASLIKSLNVPVEERIQQMLINMERMRWMPKEPEKNRIVVNIPAFKLFVYEDAQKVFDMDIVVGKAANQTVVFNNQLKHIVFSPYWNVPESIVKNEILPAMRRNPGYLSRNNMEKTGTTNGLPVIRQRPGGNNSLGRVKFLFPNSFNIYFHDTPAKSLFNRESRAFSHGCIRLSEPKKLAEYLLRNNNDWTSERIDKAMQSTKEQWVGLPQTIPVTIAYFTAWIDNEGLLNFREDIYGHDKKLAARMFQHNNHTVNIAR